jgi:hypothetical protein
VLSSQQVAAMMQQQNQMFTGMQQYSQVISAQMPQAYGIGQYGMQGPVAPQFGQVPYAPQQRPGFSYGGQSAFGYGMGNQMGAAGVAAMGGAGQFALGGLGIAGGLGLLGRAGGMAFDPFSAGMAGYSAARGIGMGVAGGLGMGAAAAGVVAAPMMFAQHALGSMVTGAQEQAGVNQSLGQYSFSNAMSRSGRGFSRTDAQAIGSVVREMQAIPEMMTSMSELTRIMDRMGQSGMMQGVRDASEFSKRFKETIHTLKDVSKMMGSTMEEAMQAFQESKQSGFYSPEAIKQNIAQRQIVGGLTGMNQQQVASLQQYGAQSSVAAGGSRMGGARSITRVAGELGMANQMGLLSNDRLMELTGEEGAAGIQQLAGSLNDVGQRMGRSSLGTAMTLALGETKDGKYTGNMDADLVQRVRSGQIGKEELLRLAHQKSQGRNAKISFAAHRQRLTTEMVNSAGAQGVAMELSTILGERGFDNPDALNLVMQRYGVDESQANQVISLMKDMPNIQRGITEAGTTEARRMSEQAFMKANASFEGVKTRISKKFENVLTEPFKRMGANISNSIGESIDSFVDDLFGRYQTKVTDIASSTALKASMGDKAAQSLVASASQDMGTTRRTARGTTAALGTDLRNDSTLGGLLNMASGQQTTGDVQASILSGMGSSYVDTIKGTGNEDVDRENILRNGGNILSKSGGVFSGGEYTVTTNAARARAAKALQGANPLTGKINTSSGIGKHALLSLKQQLLSNTDLQNEELTDQEKYAILEKQLGSSSGTGLSGGVLEQLKKQTGSDNVVDIIDALAKSGGLENQMGMFSRRGLAGGLRGAGSERALAGRITKEIDTAAGGFGDRGAQAKAVFTEGGASAKILNAAFGGGEMSDKVRLALGTKDGTPVDKSILDSLGMTQKEFDAARGQSRDLMAAGIKGGANGGDIQKLLQSQLAMGLMRNEKHEKEIGEGLTSRIAEADLGGLTDGGKGLVGRIGALAGRLTEGKGLGEQGGETADLVESLASYKGKDKTKIMGLAGDELRAGAQMITDTRSAYRHAKGGKGGKSVDDLIDRLGLTGEAAKSVRAMAGDDKVVSGSEEKTIERYLGESTTKALAGSKGADQSTVNAASKNLGDVLKTMNENAANTAALLKGLMDVKAGGGK